MALTFLTKNGYVAVEGTSVKTKRARLTAKGRATQQGLHGHHVAVEEDWRTRFGAEQVDRLRSALQSLLEQSDGDGVRLPRGLQPHPGGWRASEPYLARTQAMIEDPNGSLPHYPMVLHRGGWPDGS